MSQVILTVPDEQLAPLLKVLKALPFAIKTKTVALPKSKQYTPAQQEWIDNFREALSEADLAAQGKIKLKPARQLLDELRS